MDKRTQAKSVWIATTPQTTYASLTKDITVDVAVVGGGIAGISVAHRLKELGKKVALVESGRIVEASTGNTTAKVSSLQGLMYTTLTKNFTDEGARIYGQANEAAIDEIESIVAKYDIDCDFSRVDAYTYAQDESGNAQVKAEAEAAKRLGLPASYTADVPLPFQTFGAVKFTNQAQFHVRKYLLALAENIDGEGSSLLENTKALTIKQDGDTRQLVTDKGVVTARDIVVATHEPFYDPDGEYADLSKFRDFALGLLINQATPQGEFFSTGDDPHSIRAQPTEDGDIIIVGGKSDAEMKARSDDDAYDLTEKDYAQKFDINRVVYKWNTYDLATSDGASYIGRLSKNLPHVFVATGFNGWGMTNGVLAGMLLGDRITGNENPWSEFFDKFSRERYSR
jgi:glycine/D-amino acid oxidase-like deaminating enzyme